MVEESEGYDAHVYVCTACYEKYVDFVMEHTDILQDAKLPHNIIQSKPVPENVTEPCEKCNELATRII